MTDDIRYEIEAFNTAHASENRIHDDAVASRFGFEGGLVPGVDVYAYMTRAAVLRFGTAFLERGRISCRFALPVYDGETVTVSAAGEETLDIMVQARGKVQATAEADLPGAEPPPDIADWPAAELPAPENRPPAGSESLPEGRVLGGIDETADDAGQTQYRDDVRETHPLYADRGLVHPGFLLRRANSALKDNVLLGPWIHVGSTVRHFRTVEAGAPLRTRSRVARLYGHKGHGFVDLDVALFSGGGAVARIAHTAIYEPRQVRETA
jgi:acyl dehydratase